MKISIVTLNFNGSTETLELLKSLKEQADSNFEIIVIDNASEEDDFAHLQAGIDQLIHSFPLTTSQVGYPQVKVMRNSENFGFSGGNNVGIRQSLQNRASWVVLLNNDTWVERDFIERLRAKLNVSEDIVGIPLNEGSRTAYCGKIQWFKPTLIHRPTCDVGHSWIYAVGGAIAIHKEVFEKIGLLDENYFLYFEDADFSIRARKAKIPISIFCDTMIYHKISSSTKKLGSPLLLRYHYRNALYFNRKNGPWYIKLLVWPWSCFMAVKQLGKIIIGVESEISRAILLGIMDFYKRRFGKVV